MRKLLVAADEWAGTRIASAIPLVVAAIFLPLEGITIRILIASVIALAVAILTVPRGSTGAVFNRRLFYAFVLAKVGTTFSGLYLAIPFIWTPLFLVLMIWVLGAFWFLYGRKKSEFSRRGWWES